VVDNRCAVRRPRSAHRAVFSERSAAWISNTSHRWPLDQRSFGQSRQARERLSQSRVASLAGATTT